MSPTSDRDADGNTIYRLRNFNGDMRRSIAVAANTIVTQFLRGNVTIGAMYGGKQLAYCVGNCTEGSKNAQNFFKALGGGDANNPYDLLWPCQD